MSVAHDPRQNHLLAALPATDFERLQSRLKLVPLRLGEVIYEPGSHLRHLYVSDHGNRVPALHNGRWSLCRDRSSR